MKYFPILKSKRGEFSALKEMTDEMKRSIVPVIEVSPDSADSTLLHLRNNWNIDGNKVILDASTFFEAGNDVDDFIALMENLGAVDVNPIPCVEFDSLDPYLDALKDYFSERDTELCIRIRKRFLRPRTLISNIETTISYLGVSARDVIVLLDFEYLGTSNIDSSSDKAAECVEALADLSAYLKVVIAGGSFPENLGKIAPNARVLLKRHEWDLWNVVKTNFSDEQIAYGDYGIKHPILDPTVSTFEGTCSVKYTTESNFLILRGVKASTHPLGGGQYHEKCQILVKDPLYDGEDFSWGDEEIAACSRRTIKPGNAESWVKIGHNHHFAKILTLL